MLPARGQMMFSLREKRCGVRWTPTRHGVPTVGARIARPREDHQHRNNRCRVRRLPTHRKVTVATAGLRLVVERDDVGAVPYEGGANHAVGAIATK